MFRFTLPLALTLLAAPAMAYTTTQGARIEARGDGFEVLAQPGLSASMAFCAAGSYAQNVLRLPANARIWRASAPPRRAGQGVSFTTSAEASAGKTGLFILGPDDGSVSVAFAQSLCDSQRSRYWR